MSRNHSLRELIQGHYAQLSVVERKLADVVLEREKEALGFSATELSALAGVSTASAARFFRRLGFSGFQAFRQHLRDGAQAASPLHRVVLQGTGVGPLRQHIEQDLLRLRSLGEDATEPGVQLAVKLLGGARRVWVLGYRNGAMLALYAHALLSQVRADVHLFSEGSAQDAELLAQIQPHDLLLAMDFRRRTHRLAQLVEIACDAGAALLLLSDARLSTLAARARAVLVCPPREGAVFDSYVGAVSLINYQATATLAQSPQTARTRMARIEKAHARLADLEPHV